MRKLIDLYYTMWVDTIIKFKSVPINKDDWKSKSMMLVSAAMGIQFILVLFALSSMGLPIYKYYNINLDIFPGERLDGMLNGTILFFLPFFILNYFLIFFKKKHINLIKNYEYKNGKYYFIYVLGTFFIGLILTIIFIIWLIVTK